MGLIWWILPAVAGVIGLMLLFAGFGKLARLKPLAGGGRLFFGVGFLGLGFIVLFAGLNLQTYKQLTKEREVATIRFFAVESKPNTFRVDVEFKPGGESLLLDGSMPELVGDEFEIGAQVLKFHPFQNLLNYDSVYRLSYIEGRFADRYVADAVTTAQTTGVNLTKDPGLNLRAFAKKYGQRIGIEDSKYGSATFQPMGDGFEFDIWITQDALISRPSEKTKVLIEKLSYPGYVQNGKTIQ